MKNFVIFALHQALVSLEGYIHEGNLKPYEFEPMGNHAISKNLRLLADPFREIQVKHSQLIYSLLPQGAKRATFDRSGPEWKQYEKEWLAFLNEETPVNLYRVEDHYFHFETNPVPLATQKALAPILLDVPLKTYPDLVQRSDSVFGLQDYADSSAGGRGDSVSRD